MPFHPKRELKKLNRKIGWLCITLLLSTLTFLIVLLGSFLARENISSQTSILLTLLVCVIAGTWSGVALDKAYEQQRNLELQIRYSYMNKKGR